MTSQVCVDAGLLLRGIFPTPQDKNVDSLLETWIKTGVEIVSSPLLDVEVTSVFRKLVDLKRLSVLQAEQAYSLYREIGVVIMNPPTLSEKAWQFAMKYDFSLIHDMQYLALAEIVDCDLWTANQKLFRSLKENKRLNFIGDQSSITPTVEKRVETSRNTRTDFPGLWREI